MPDSDRPSVPRAGETLIDASQLRPGVYVRLPVPWAEHPFMFNAFVIADEEQARQVAALKLPQLFCDLARCKVPPLVKPAAESPSDPAAVAEAARLATLRTRQMTEKQARAKVMAELRARLDKAQKHYVGAAKAVGSALQDFARNPEESVRQVSEVSLQSTAALLADPDSAIVLIAEKAQADGAAAHSLSVMTLSLLLGKQARLPEEALHTLGVAALFHDIGKLGLPATVLRNPTRNKHEEAFYQEHCRRGQQAALACGQLAPAVVDAILHHHERANGSGFPDHLAGKEIQVAARVVAIADRFDNLTNPVDTRRAVSPSEALSLLWTREQKFFDHALLQIFIRAMGVFPPGSIVQLSDGRVGAVVISAESEKPLCPQVMLYDPDVPRRQAIIIDLAREDGLRVDRALRLQERPSDELDYLLPRRRLNWFHTGSGGTA